MELNSLQTDIEIHKEDMYDENEHGSETFRPWFSTSSSEGSIVTLKSNEEEKSQFTALNCLSNQEEDRIYLPEMKSKHTDSRSLKDEISIVLSLLYGLFVVVLTSVISFSQYFSTGVNVGISLYYFAILYSVGILWLIYCCAKMCKENLKVRSKSTPNLWFKGVVMLFGFAIVVKKIFTLIITTEASFCQNKWLRIVLIISHIAFTIAQVIFLLHYGTNNNLASRHLSRFGIAHVLVTNLSMWISNIAEEVDNALQHLEQNDAEKLVTTSSYNDSMVKDCMCATDTCTWMTTAVRFLWPFQIEFCLISGCLLYVMWKKVGRKTLETYSVAKPCHKLYGSYTGTCVGAMIFAITVVVIAVLTVLGQNPANNQKTILTKHQYVALHHDFMIACNCVIIFLCVIACFIEFATTTQKKKNVSANLDTTLLFVCLTGPFILDLFSIFSLLNGKSVTESTEWNIFLALPITDIAANTVQILFIVYWLAREPVTEKCKQTEKIYYNNAFLDNLRGTSANANSVSRRPHLEKSLGEDGELVILDCKSGAVIGTSFASSTDQQTIRKDITKVTNEIESETDVKQDQTRNQCLSQIQLSSVIINTPANFFQPCKKRIVIRDIILVLICINASLWLFLSLDGILFEILYTYEYKFFGPQSWTILSSIATPLSIYLTMHSAACLFEIWSYS